MRNRDRQPFGHNPFVLHRCLTPETTRGIGIFSCERESVRAPFTLVEYPSDRIIVIQGSHFGFQASLGESLWQLEGSLNDGSPISCECLTMRGWSLGRTSGTEFFPLGFVQIGDKPDEFPSELQYPLVGYFDGGFALDDDDWSISVSDGATAAKRAKQLYRGWGVVTEGMILTLKHSKARFEEYGHKARQITNLLALASGTGVTFHRFTAKWRDGGRYEMRARGTSDEVGPGHCVPSHCMQAYVEQTLPLFRTWPDLKRDLYRLLVGYINLSNTGYLDIRFQQVWEAWEVLANNWGPKTVLSAAEAVLKSEVLQVCRQWRKQNSNADPEHTWPERLAFSFRWPRARRQLQQMVADRGLRIDKLELDLDKLKKARDSVSHSGKLPTSMVADKAECLSLLHGAQFGLQLLLLSELGYSGLVDAEENGWRAMVHIDGFFQSK